MSLHMSKCHTVGNHVVAQIICIISNPIINKIFIKFYKLLITACVKSIVEAYPPKSLVRT